MCPPWRGTKYPIRGKVVASPKHSYDILGARMLWKPKEARILKNFKKNYRSTNVIW
jgi:hypothetical protein